jgi:hypothetical protein
MAEMDQKPALEPKGRVKMEKTGSFIGGHTLIYVKGNPKNYLTKIQLPLSS